jgi:hypothetical protein
MLENEDVEITASQREELERAWLDPQQNPDAGESWEDVQKSLQNEDRSHSLSRTLLRAAVTPDP